tara:strand:- start:13598 stop:14491 length:894 start_codon:yes stop_codon:yes gene_type:complete
MSLDNQAIETRELFYPPSDDSERPTPTEEEEVKEPEQSEDESETDNPDSETNEDDTEQETDEEEDEEESEGSEELYIELDDDEVSLDTIREWKKEAETAKSERLMHADYSRKTEALAKQRKEVEEQAGALDELIPQLEAAIKLDDDIDWKELKEDDPEEYIRLKEQSDKRKALLKEAKEKQPERETVTEEDLQAERKALWDANPDWIGKDGKPSKVFEQDMTIAKEYLEAKGYKQDEVSQIVSARHWQTIIDAAKFTQAQKKGSALRKKVNLKPRNKKPGTTTVETPKSDADLFYSN